MDRIFSIWPTIAALAVDLGVKYQTAAAWKRRGSIPAVYDVRVVSIARQRGTRVTLEELANSRHRRRLLKTHMGPTFLSSDSSSGNNATQNRKQSTKGRS